MGWTMDKKSNSDSKLLNVTAGNRVCVIYSRRDDSISIHIEKDMFD